jgi:epoxyqueuosine reductase
MKEQIQKRAQALGFDACRCTTAAAPESGPRFQAWLEEKRHGAMDYLERNAFKRIDPQQVLPGMQSVIVLAAAYPEIEKEQKADSFGSSTTQPGEHEEAAPAFHGVIARYARFKDYHDVLAEKLKDLTAYVNELGGAGTRSLWYVDTGPILERDLAQRAGLGFVGKHTNLISRELGNWFFISEILTTLALPADEPEKNRCGTCTRCIVSCPTQAITGPFQLDARRCISYLTIELKGSIPVELRPAIGNRIYGCDDCLAACPWNRFAREGSLMKPHARADLDVPELLELLSLNAAEFKRRFEGTPLLRTKRRGVLRNVCVALGNIGNARALPALEHAAQDPEPLIAEHASWAINRIRERLNHQTATESAEKILSSSTL